MQALCNNAGFMAIMPSYLSLPPTVLGLIVCVACLDAVKISSGGEMNSHFLYQTTPGWLLHRFIMLLQSVVLYSFFTC